MKTIHVKGQKFLVEVIYKRKNKKTYLRVKDGIIIVTSPKVFTEQTLASILDANYQTIIKLMNKRPKVEDKIHYLGKEYNLIVKKSLDNMIYISGNDIIVEVKHISKEAVVELTSKLYASTLEKIVKLYEVEVKNKFNIKFKVDYQYKNVKTYFGKCFISQRKIFFATMLCKYDLKYIISVIYHEYAHFKVSNHQKEFYNLLESVYPNYKQVDRQLKKIYYKDVY